jgi:hypothetical protein
MFTSFKGRSPNTILQQHILAGKSQELKLEFGASNFAMLTRSLDVEHLIMKCAKDIFP